MTDLLETMPEENLYDMLKTAIIKRTDKSDETMPRDFFNNVELGERIPWQLLRHMKDLLGSKVRAENILRTLWFNAMTQD